MKGWQFMLLSMVPGLARCIVLCLLLAIDRGVAASSPTIAPTVVPTATPSTARSSLNSITTYAGSGSSTSSGTGGLATAAGVGSPRFVWMDSTNVVYISEWSSSCVRKVDAAGIVQKVVGVCGTTGSTANGGQATAAIMNGVYGVFISSVGVLYACEYTSSKVRSVSTAGIYGTYAGTGTATNTGDNGQATSATINTPFSIWGNTAGTVYIASYSGSKFRAISPTGIISTFAGTGISGFTGDSGPATSATFTQPRGMFGDTMGRVYLSDSGSGVMKVRLVDSVSIITTFAGTGNSGYSGENVVATSSNLNVPAGLFKDSNNGDVFIACYNSYRVQVYTAYNGKLTTFAGSGTTGSTGDGSAASAAKIASAEGLYWDRANSNLYIADLSSSRVRMTYSTVPSTSPTPIPSVAPVVNTAAPSRYYRGIKLVMGTGVASSAGTGGLATAATLNNPRSIQSDTTGVIYVSEYGSHCIRTIDVLNIVHAFAGVCGTSGSAGDGGAASSALLNQPIDFAVVSAGALYITDTGNNKIRAVILSVSVMAYLGGAGGSSNTGDGGPLSAANIYKPNSIWINSATTAIYIASSSGNVIRYFGNTAIINAYAGTGSSRFAGDNGPATSASLSAPQRVYGDTVAGIYISDGGNNLVRKVSTTGILSTFMGTGTTVFLGEGLAATSTSLSIPTGMAVDTSNGDFYVNSFSQSRTYYLSASTQTVNTVIGTGVSGSSGDDGAATLALLAGPDGLFLDFSTGLLYVVDQTSNTLRATYSTAPTTAPTPKPSISFTPTVQPTSIRSPANVKLYAGVGTAASSGTGGLATAAGFNSPISVWMDTTNVVYVAEFDGNCIRTIDTSGIVHSFAGVCGSSGSSGDSGPATSALLHGPGSIQVVSWGAVYIADYSNNKVRGVVQSTGNIYTVVGVGAGSDSGDGGRASAANINAPMGLWYDSAAINFYISSYSGQVIRAVSTTAIISTYAGKGSSGFSGDGGKATSAAISFVTRLYGDTTGKLYLSDENNNRVRTISTANIITTFLGTGSTTYTGENVPGTSVALSAPAGMAVDPSNGDFYLNCYSHRRAYVLTATTQMVSTFLGTGVQGSTTLSGQAATSVPLGYNDGLYLDSNGQLYIADMTNMRVIQTFTATPTVAPTIVPTAPPTIAPSCKPSVGPTITPTVLPSVVPTLLPTQEPTVIPTIVPTVLPTVIPTTATPTIASLTPTFAPSVIPTASPTLKYLSIRSSPSYKVTNALAFAGVTSSGSVMVWGAAGSGGDCSSVSALLTDVKEVVSSKNAFAALKNDGTIVAWGLEREINRWSSATSGETVTSLAATEQAFAGVTSSGGVIAFGADCCGGNVDQYGWAQYLTSGVVSVRASAGAFCALKTDGTVYCWGTEFTGGGVSSVNRSDLKSIVLLSSTRSAFAGMTSDGSVVAWGNGKFGGRMSSSVVFATSGLTQHILSNGVSFVAYTSTDHMVSWGDSESNMAVGSDVKYVAHTASAFAAVRNNGSVLSWGDSESGGGVSLSENVTHIVGSQAAFAALSYDGSVRVWGEREWGGVTSFNGTGPLDNILAVYSTSRAFAALNSSGSVLAWGAASAGGLISAGISSHLASGVKLICANELAFTAIKQDGTAFAWGFAKALGGSGSLTGDFSEIVVC